VLRQLRPPHRLLVILEGESLLNDATALMIYRAAVAAVGGSAVFGWQIAPDLILTTIGGAALGWVMARGWMLLPMHRFEIAISVLVQFIGTFAVWIIAVRLGVSAIITVVVYAMVIARWAPMRMGARHRIASYAVWDVVVFVLNVLAFVLIGLQLKAILGRLVATTVCAAVILVRIVWVMGYNTALRWKLRRFGDGGGRKLMPPTFQGGILVSWCGMRGIVTLASALALPQDFAYRDLIVFCAFCVVLGTLVVQGLTLRPLMQHLSLPEDPSVEQEILLGRQETARAAMKALERYETSDAATLLQREYRARAEGAVEASGVLAQMQSQAVAAQRAALIQLRRGGIIGDTAFHAIEEELDIIELTADPRVRSLDTPR
jgi:NhaP-type Na+/H+ or K+/H+ antiporter